ncbi:hypothetical protein N1027_11915 [Herbiconiux sp. CPCC 205763]|uniref:Uncharacterized protein n=1 Tax=Herbiconiux aconitum TaxID=2970913 RepID=A0ABT2GRJ3_9MICO|nr:hypothetical protein [Herbiconiux aconitum]MCS5718841.1 hypothetical protein [Herbiconiux aconitum]
MPTAGRGTMPPITPASITVARFASIALVGLSVIQDVVAARGIDWAAYEEHGTGVVVFFAIVISTSAIVGLAITALPFWLIRRGSRVTAIAITLIVVWQASLAVITVDPLQLIAAIIAIVAAVSIWVPASRAHLAWVRADRLARRRETVYPNRRRRR